MKTPRKLFARILIVISVLTLSMGPIETTYALDTNFYAGNGIYFYDPDVTCMSSGGAGIRGKTNVEKIYNYLIDHGLNAQQAGGILGSIKAESGFSATRHEMGQPWEKGGYGIAQWTGSRRTQIVKAIKDANGLGLNLMDYYKAEYGAGTSKENGYIDKGLPIAVSDRLLLIELDFMYQEATSRTVRSGVGTKGTTEWVSVSKAASEREASDIWYFSFERPLVQNETNAAARAKLGVDALSEIDASTLTPPSTSCPPATGDVSALQSLVKDYAWPTYKGHGFIEPKKAYADAITEARKNRQYLGGINHPGIDCGGYVTRLIINSGWDPAYNYNGKGGATPTQEKWVNANWEKLGHITDTKQLKPGDVAMEPGHTWVFVGTIAGFDSNQSSASLDNRAPMASSSAEAAKATDKTTTWYRKKGTQATP